MIQKDAAKQNAHRSPAERRGLCGRFAVLLFFDQEILSLPKRRSRLRRRDAGAVHADGGLRDLRRVNAEESAQIESQPREDGGKQEQREHRNPKDRGQAVLPLLAVRKSGRPPAGALINGPPRRAADLAGALHFATDIFSAKSRVRICKHSVNEQPSSAAWEHSISNCPFTHYYNFICDFWPVFEKKIF